MVIVDHQQIGETDLARIVILTEGKGVTRMQPTEIGKPALIGLAYLQHVIPPRADRGRIIASVYALCVD